MNQIPSLTDLTDEPWALIKDFIPPEKPGGRHRTVNMREMVNAILSVTVSGIQWRLMPHDLPNWSSVYGYFRDWRNTGVWPRIPDTLRAQVRQQEGRHKHPTAAAWIPNVSKPRRALGHAGMMRANR